MKIHNKEMEPYKKCDTQSDTIIMIHIHLTHIPHKVKEFFFFVHSTYSTSTTATIKKVKRKPSEIGDLFCDCGFLKTN